MLHLILNAPKRQNTVINYVLQVSKSYYHRKNSNKSLIQLKNRTSFNYGIIGNNHHQNHRFLSSSALSTKSSVILLSSRLNMLYDSLE